MKLNILIFEDERLSAERLIQLVGQYDKEIVVSEVLSSVKQGIAWFTKNPKPDLILMDIHLSDGSCFEIFEKVNIETPVIFTTAYDEYAIKAFKVNSVDYLLKPIDFQELSAAFEKFARYDQTRSLVQKQMVQALYDEISKVGKYKQRFLVKVGEQLKRMEASEIAWFMFDDGLVWAANEKGVKLPLEFSLDQLEQMLDPQSFFRINRKLIVNISAVEKIHTYFNSRLKLRLQPDPGEEVIVSRERVNDFKEWLE